MSLIMEKYGLPEDRDEKAIMKRFEQYLAQETAAVASKIEQKAYKDITVYKTFYPAPAPTSVAVDNHALDMINYAFRKHLGIGSHDRGCQHDWKQYIGFTQTFEYCTKCDEKRNMT